MEVWKTIYETYRVSNLGKVESLPRYLKEIYTSHNYMPRKAMWGVHLEI